MLEQLKNEANRAATENGARSLLTTESDCLDLFATVGALRHARDEEIEKRFCRAFAENRDYAMKLLFFARDIRGGLGERHSFRVMLAWLAENYPEVARKSLAHIPEYGRYDDLLTLIGTPLEQDALELIKERFSLDMRALENGDEVSLLGKWLPSVNASSAVTRACGRKIAGALGLSYADYRHALTALRAHIHIIENNLRERDYSFDYSKQPSRAMLKYRAAFMRNDEERYSEFLDRVSLGETTVHTDTLAPYELVESYLTSRYKSKLSEKEARALNVTWDNLPDFGNPDNAIAIVDTSGSMYCCYEPSPASVALSLGLYLAEHNTGAFKGHFIEFSSKPKLIEIKGESFVDRLRYISSFCEIANTNIEAVFRLILDTAVKNNLPEEMLPKKLIIISDMEFDWCAEGAELTNFENAKRLFASAGYKLPDIVFWNVASRNRHQPVTKNEQGVALVSGCSPRLFSMVAGGLADPYTLMVEVLESERYAVITA